MNYYDIVVKETLLLIMAIAILRTVGKEPNVWQKLVSTILIVGLAVVFTAWIVDTALWLVAEIMQSPLVRPFLTPSPQGLALPQGLTLTRM
jgi:hypothetical protein